LGLLFNGHANENHIAEDVRFDRHTSGHGIRSVDAALRRGRVTRGNLFVIGLGLGILFARSTIDGRIDARRGVGGRLTARVLIQHG
jgi:hypothetical protein